MVSLSSRGTPTPWGGVSCGVRQTPMVPCVRRSQANGKKAGEILGSIGHCSALRAGASFGHSTGAARRRPGYGRLVGHTHRVHLRIDATGTKQRADPHRRARRTPRLASPDADMDRDATERRIAQHGRTVPRRASVADSGRLATRRLSCPSGRPSKYQP